MHRSQESGRREHTMLIWLAIPLGAGIVAALIAVIRRSGVKGIYTNGIIEKCFELDTDRDCLQVRAYVDETLVHELPAPSKLIFFFNDTATTEIYPLSLHDALPISAARDVDEARVVTLAGRVVLEMPA